MFRVGRDDGNRFDDESCFDDEIWLDDRAVDRVERVDESRLTGNIVEVPLD